ncbi:MAG TPA: RNA polymerase subunit sigma-24 [Eubacteriaceae bacterium]|nr:RNA polymerase subunit sigma-24 [Eubacteriaceae bacterium]
MEKSLLKRLKNQDQDAYRELYDEYGSYALRTAFAITGNEANASDAVQETFIRIYLNISSYDGSRPFKPWMYRILINECNRLLKKNSKLAYIQDYKESSLRLSYSDSHRFEEYEQLYKGLQTLKEIHRLPLILKYLSGFSDEETAKVLEINVNTLKSRVHKGKQKLKKRMEEQSEGGKVHE